MADISIVIGILTQLTTGGGRHGAPPCLGKPKKKGGGNRFLRVIPPHIKSLTQS